MSTKPVSIVIPALDDFDLFEANLPALVTDLVRRDAKDEIVLVDDTGRDVLAAWLRERRSAFVPAGSRALELRVLARPRNGGFAEAAATGVEGSRHEHVMLLNPDVRVRPRFLEPLVLGLADPRVFACVPRVLLNGREGLVESLMRMRWERGRVRVEEHGSLYGDPIPSEPTPVAFGVGGAICMRRAEFLERGGFDSMYQPFYWEDIDLGWSAWREGRRILFQPDSVVEHHHRGTIGRSVPPELVRAAIERNTHLFTWKFLDDRKLAREHMSSLYARVFDLVSRRRHADLLGLALALEELPAVEARRRGLAKSPATFGEILATAQPTLAADSSAHERGTGRRA